MKMNKLTVVLCFCSSVVFSETTVEMIQQRAEAGDATAQTLMGMMSFYGCQLPKDRKAAQEWYQRAADQGDFFAAGRVAVKNQAEVPQADSSVKPPSKADDPPWEMSKETLEKKVSNASSAEYKGEAELEDMILHRSEYVGKVVKLRFRSGKFFPEPGMPHIYVRGIHGMGGPSQCLMVSGQEAMEWAVKKSSGAVREAYALVDDNRLIALGTKQSQADNGYIYSW